MHYKSFSNFFNQIFLLFDVESYLECANSYTTTTRIQFLFILVIQVTLLNLEPLHLSDSVGFLKQKVVLYSQETASRFKMSVMLVWTIWNSALCSRF